MKRENPVSLLLLFLCLNALAQSDTAPVIGRDTIPYPASIPARPENTVNEPLFKEQADTTGKIKSQIQSENIYKIKSRFDIPIAVAGTGWSIYTFTRIYKKGPSTEEQILALKKSDINAFDRSAVRPYSKSIDDVSYYPFYGVMPLPFIFFLTGTQMRGDFAELSFLYWETFSVQGLFGASATYFVDRYRPYTYSSETPMDKRMSQNSKNSFFAGHVEVMATSTFFIAKVYSDYYPDSKIKWVFYGAATAATGAMAYLRYAAGMHFASDIILGATTGALSGILVPHFHKHPLIKNHDTSLIPFMNGETKGLAVIFR